MELRRQRSASFLENLSPEAGEKLLALAEVFAFAANDVIFHQDDKSEYLYIVKAGEVGIEIHVPPRGPRTILTLGPGDVFNWSALIEPHLATASVRAIVPTTVVGIRGKCLMEMCRRDYPVGFEVYHALACAISARLVATRLQLLDVFAVP